MTKDEALDLALEALEYIHEGANNQGPHTGISWRCVVVKAEAAITAIKQARALDKKAENARELGLDYEPAQPVVWHDAPQTIYLQVCPEADHCEVRFADHDEVTWCQDKIHDSDIAYVRASTTQQPPAQRTWQGLTDEEITDIWAESSPYYHEDDFARAIEAKLRSKNNG